MRRFASILALAALTACGTSNPDGSVATGPLGRQPLMTPEVQTLTRTALDACVAAKTRGTPLATLQAKGFAPFRGGFRAGISNPLIMFDGKSYVWARFEREACAVFTGPVYPIELETLSAVTRAAVADAGRPFELSYRRRNDGLDALIK